ncbi:MAG TPA: glycosyltransferase family 39 protein, partial [Anaerolineae bacterium]|nr:glycosyltransferase family 39 protein [Anaerolineae bacterium]
MRMFTLPARRAHSLPLAVILAAGLGLRLWGSGFGLPAFTHYHPDEHAVVERATAILQTGEWGPERFNYPPFAAYLQVAGFAASLAWGRALGRWDQAPPYPLPQHFQLARATTALVGTLTILAVYLAGRQVWGRRVGLLAAALLAGNYLHIIHSHYATMDVMAGLFVALCLLFSQRALVGRGAGNYALAGLCAGLAGATKYNGAVALAMPVAALLLGTQGRHLVVGRLLATAAGLGLGFFGGNPFALARWSAFGQGVTAVLEHYGTGHPGFEGLGNWLWYLYGFVTSADAAWVVAGLAGLLGAARFGGRHGLLLLVFPVTYFWLVSSFVVRFERNMVLLLPFLALGGGWLLSHASQRFGRGMSPRFRRSLAVGGAAALLALPLAAGLAFDVQLSRIDHREVAGLWLEQNVEAGARIAIEHYAIPFDHGAYEVADVIRIADHDLEWYRQAGYDLLVVSDGTWEVLRRQARYYGDRLRAYDELVAGSTLLAEFVPDPPGIVVAGYQTVAVYHFAPVRIYRLPQ